MAVDPGQIRIDPYKSDIPLVQFPTETPPPAQPLRGEFKGKANGPLAIGDAIVKGFLQGHAVKEQRKNQQAQATIAAADAGADAAYQKYQDALSQSGGKADDPGAKSAYEAYVGVFNASKQAKAKFVMPEELKKGQKKDKKDGIPGIANIKEWFQANPHVIPSIALLSMQPKPPGQSRDTKEADLRSQALQGQVDLQKTELSGEQARQKSQQDVEARAAQQRKVEASGGIDAVLADKGADPTLKQAASEMKFSQLDAQTPEGKMKSQFYQDQQSGKSKEWTPQQRALAGELGAAPPLVPTTIRGKNGHDQQLMIDPMTGQAVAGSKPLDLGPPAWAGEFYAKRAADNADLQKAVAGNPAAYGVQLSGDPKKDKVAVDARVAQMRVQAEFGIQSLAQSAGKTGYEVQRDNSWLSDTVKDLDSNFGTAANPKTASFDWPGGGKVELNKEQANQILGQFLTDPTQTAGIRTFRPTAEIGGGKDAGAAERDRLWAYQFVKNRMMAAKGKQALTSEQADQILKDTALGRPIPQQSQQQSGMTRPPSQGKQMGMYGNPLRSSGGGAMTAPPTGATKMYLVLGENGQQQAVSLTDAEAAQSRANNIPLESADFLNQ